MLEILKVLHWKNQGDSPPYHIDELLLSLPINFEMEPHTIKQFTYSQNSPNPNLPANKVKIAIDWRLITKENSNPCSFLEVLTTMLNYVLSTNLWLLKGIFNTHDTSAETKWLSLLRLINIYKYIVPYPIFVLYHLLNQLWSGIQGVKQIVWIYMKSTVQNLVIITCFET